MFAVGTNELGVIHRVDMVTYNKTNGPRGSGPRLGAQDRLRLEWCVSWAVQVLGSRGQVTRGCRVGPGDLGTCRSQ